MRPYHCRLPSSQDRIRDHHDSRVDAEVSEVPVANEKAAKGLSIVRIALGIFFLFQGLGKLEWFVDPGILSERFSDWLGGASPLSRWYLETVAIPGAPAFAALVPVGELAAGVALVLGTFTRVAAALSFLMVLNFHVASGALFHYRFLTHGYGLPVLGPLLGLAIGGRRLPWSARR